MHSCRFIFRALALCLAFAGSLVLTDYLLGLVLFHRGQIAEVVEIGSPSTLEAKLDYLRHFPGYKVVLLGDSVVFGQVLQEHGDEQWREHNLATQLQTRLQALYPDRQVLVMNLGMGGALPGDQLLLARRLDDCGVDLVILDISLRAFSADFSKPEALLSRPWLAECSHGESAPQHTDPERFLSSVARHCWGLYRCRDFLQARLFGATPHEALEDARAALEKKYQRKDTSSGPHLDDDLVLTLKARRRYQSIHLEPQHAQRQALEELLTHLEHRRQRTLVFYAAENPERVDELLPCSRYEALRLRLDDIITRHTSANLLYVPGIRGLSPSHYLDHGHVNAEGYAIMSQELLRQASPLLP